MTNKSVWGVGEELTLNKIREEPIKGIWLDLGAGDGRYVPELLKRADRLVLGDIDPRELTKVQKYLSKSQRSKINMEVFDITKRFPFSDSSFEGIFCTGILHLFSKEKLEDIFLEINRVLKPDGKIIIDFATDVKRILPNGDKLVLSDKPEYSLLWEKEDVYKMLKKILENYDLNFESSSFRDDLTKDPRYGFKTEGNFFLIIGIKKI